MSWYGPVPAAVAPQTQQLVGDLAALFVAPTDDAALAILCEQQRRDFPQYAVELTVDMLIFTGRKICADIAPAPRSLH